MPWYLAGVEPLVGDCKGYKDDGGWLGDAVWDMIYRAMDSDEDEKWAPLLRVASESGHFARAAARLGIDRWQHGCLPADKTERLEQLASEGRCVLMVGDGLNDAPSLVAAHVSMSPTNAADVSQTAADLLFQGAGLAPVLTAIRVARMSTRLVKQNFALAFLYNSIAVPLAVMGLATPLVAAVAMSSSSIVVTLNALRLKWVR